MRIILKIDRYVLNFSWNWLLGIITDRRGLNVLPHRTYAGKSSSSCCDVRRRRGRSARSRASSSWATAAAAWAELLLEVGEKRKTLNYSNVEGKKKRLRQWVSSFRIFIIIGGLWWSQIINFTKNFVKLISRKKKFQDPLLLVHASVWSLMLCATVLRFPKFLWNVKKYGDWTIKSVFLKD